MQIKQWGLGDNPYNYGGIRIIISPQDAIKIIRGLAHQIECDDDDRGPTFYDDKGKSFNIKISRGEKSPHKNQLTSEEKIEFDGCYHTGLAYSLGYQTSEGEIELAGETFTNLNTGLNGGAIESLRKHREQFDPNRDVEQFIVALKPVKIISGREEDENYKLEDDTVSGCDFCCDDDRVDGKTLCQYCLDNMCEECKEQFINCDCEFIEDVHCQCHCTDDNARCDDCNERLDDCCCDDACDDCGEWIENCVCDDCCVECGELDDDCICDDDDEFCEEFVSDKFCSMNAFARARWIQAQKRSNKRG